MYSSLPHSRGGTSNHPSMPLRNWLQDSPRMSNYKMLKSHSQPSLFLNSTSQDSTNPVLCIVCHLWLVESSVAEHADMEGQLYIYQKISLYRWSHTVQTWCCLRISWRMHTRAQRLWDPSWKSAYHMCLAYSGQSNCNKCFSELQ